MSEDYYKVAQACYESGGDVKKLIDLLYQLPTERNTKVNVDVNDAIANLNYLKQVAAETGTKIAGVTSPGGAISTDGYETGGTVNESGVYTVNESGVELVDSFGTSTASNYSLGAAVQGEYAYLSSGTKVTNALMTTKKMESMIDSKLSSAMNMYMAQLNKTLVSALGNATTDSKGNIIITMNNPNFVSENDKKKQLNELSNLIRGARL